MAAGRLSDRVSGRFPPDYATARAWFRDAAARRGWALEAHPIAGQGPRGEDLTIDVAIAPARGPRALVVSSALHGVEGPLGTALQLAWLERGDPSRRVVLLHGLNPFGYAWSRRVNEENVDLNRNFLLQGETFHGAPAGYRRLNALLNPPGPPRWDLFPLRAAWRIAREGMPALKSAVAVGQYDFPRGLFFGGRGPSATQRVLAEELPRWLAGCDEVVHADVHTGLGRWGTLRSLIDHPIDAAQRAVLNSQVGQGQFDEWDKNDIAYRARGTLGAWCVERLGPTRHLYLCLEFGTDSPITVLAGLRAENQAYHATGSTSAETRAAQARLRALFCPAAPSWRRRVFDAGWALLGRLAP